MTVTSTGTIPSATGTITTSPTTPTSTTSSARQTIIKGARYGSNDDDQEQNQEQDQDQDQEQDQELAQPAQAYPAELMDEQALQAALAAGAQEYEVVTTEHEVQELAELPSKAARPPKAITISVCDAKAPAAAR